MSILRAAVAVALVGAVLGDKCATTLAVGSIGLEGPFRARGAVGEGVSIVLYKDGGLSTVYTIRKNVTEEDDVVNCQFGKAAMYCGATNGNLLRITDRETVNKFSSGGPFAITLHVALLPTAGESDNVITANYGGSSVTSHLWDSEWVSNATYAVPASFATGAAGVPSRQEAPHPHQVVPVSDTEVIVPDLGSDKVLKLRVDAAGSAVTLDDAIDLENGDGPRHAVWNAETRSIYVVNELSITIERIGLGACGAAAGKLANCGERMDLVVLANGTSATASEIRLSSDKRFLYASIRYNNGLNGSIVGVSLSADGAIGEKIGEWSTHGVLPVDFVFLEKAGCPTKLAAVNTFSNSVVVLDVDTTTGVVGSSPTASLAVGSAISIIEVPDDSSFHIPTDASEGSAQLLPGLVALFSLVTLLQ